MGKFIGRDSILDQLEKLAHVSGNELKGLTAEIEVGDLLTKFLPDDTYIITHPIIGKYEPDFLVISPRYGFRLIEVKNWSFKYINSLQSNGSIQIFDRTTNPLSQVRKQLDDLKGYLLSNYKSLGDPHKLIGCVVIHYGFTSESIESSTSTWTESNMDDFFKYHLFRDQLTSQLDQRLSLATKFNTKGISLNIIEEFVRHVRISKNIISENELELVERTNEVNKAANEVKELAEQTKQMLEHQKRLYTAKQEIKTDSNKKNFNLWPLVGSIVVIVGILLFYWNNQVKTPLDLPNTNAPVIENSNDTVRLYGEVIDFSYDKNSGTKFLVLSDGKDTINAIIFKDIKVPFINKGDSFLFEGKLQQYKGELELNISKVETY
ncbi:NERD domain-containing protein [Calidifontibacillus oryziterrae]|uniref:NERD domain-containing protein n=1 Tax=Calidifontibacillus oryziterrae TaxID=1191699 RepID=UPI0002EF6E3E|nr:NERD domain-containing protein [Calidifontibacillus oryziterrae]